MMAKVYQDRRARKKGGVRPWCISYVGLDGKRHRDRTPATTKAEAEAILRKRMSEITKAKLTDSRDTESLKPRGFEQFMRDEYLPHCKATHTASTYTRDQSLAARVLKHFGRMTLRAIGSGDVQRYVDQRVGAESRYKKPVRPATVNRELMCISGALTEAMKRGYIDRNPVVGVPQLPEHNDRLRWLTSKEEERVLGYAPEFLKPIVLTALHAGMRRGEIMRLKWADVDFDQRLIRVAESKSHKTRYIPINKTLFALLEAIEPFTGPKGPSPYVFTNPVTGTRYEDVSHTFDRAATKAGFDDVTFHTLRHTFASRMAQDGVPLKAIQELLGHGTMQMTMRYAHLGPNNLRDAVAALDVVREAKSDSRQEATGQGRIVSRRAK
jgi:integrase